MDNEYMRTTVLSVPEMKTHYEREYPAYHPNPHSIEQLKSLMAHKKITIVLGTWCRDIQVQVARFYKIMDLLNINDTRIKLITVDTMKQAKYGQIDGLNISRIPVFIFEQNQAEVGRITETPATTLEEDMIKILNS